MVWKRLPGRGTEGPHPRAEVLQQAPDLVLGSRTLALLGDSGVLTAPTGGDPKSCCDMNGDRNANPEFSLDQSNKQMNELHIDPR